MIPGPESRRKRIKLEGPPGMLLFGPQWTIQEKQSAKCRISPLFIDI